MFAVLAFVAATIAAVLAFAHIGDLSIIGLVACAIALLALDAAFHWPAPWHRPQ